MMAGKSQMRVIGHEGYQAPQTAQTEARADGEEFTKKTRF
jgi:hypothetical protein